MQSFEIIQKILSARPTYEVQLAGRAGVIATVTGKIITMAPRLTMIEGRDGREIGFLKGNVLKTTFVMSDVMGKELGVLKFPLLSVGAKFKLLCGGKTYRAEGGIVAFQFSCIGPSGEVAFSIDKRLDLRDRFVVEVAENFNRDVALLAAVAIDQKYFEEN